MRGAEDRAQLVVRDVGDRPPGRDARVPERLRLPEVADSRDESLVEQRVADRARRLRAQTREHRVEIGRGIEDVRAEVRAPRGVATELEHRPVPEHRLVLVAAQHEPGPAGAARTALLDAPAADHAQVAAQHEPALETQKEVLPTASTDSSIRPSSRSTSPFAAARGCGVSTSTRWPASTWSRCAAR